MIGTALRKQMELNMMELKGVQFTALLNELQTNFPPTNPTPETSLEQIMYRAGQRSVIEYIVNRLEEL